MIASVLSDDLSGLAAAITAVALLVTAVDTRRKVKQIDRAVNGKPPGASTMVAQVQDLHDDKFPIIEEINGKAMLPLLREIAAGQALHLKQDHGKE